jgi:murein DD-endopeptidase
MMKQVTVLIALASLLGVPLASGERLKLQNSFAMRTAPRIVPAHHNGNWELVYELHIVNCSKMDLTLSRLELLEVQSGKVRAALDDAALAGAIGRMDRQPAVGVERRIPPGVEAIVYMSVEWPEQVARSVTLKHRVTYSADSGDPLNATVEGGEFQVLDEAPVVLGAPLRGGDWTPIYNDSWKLGHRRVIYTTDGVEHIPGRFAIDWMKVATDGTHAKGDEANPANWYGYGADVLAVADATVSVAMDDIPDPQIVEPHKVVEIENASGNYIVLDLENGKYAFYEHLKSGSIRVRAGERVRRGQVIAELGYTGQSTGPHLHFHVADSTMPLSAEGLPYVFQEFNTVGAFSSAEQFGEGRSWTAADAKKHSLELPIAFSVVEFP